MRACACKFLYKSCGAPAHSRASKIYDKNIIYTYYRRLGPPDRRIDGGFI